MAAARESFCEELRASKAALDDAPAVVLSGSHAATSIVLRVAQDAVHGDAMRHVAAGTAAGMTQVLAGYPFDTIKVRLQSQASMAASNTGLMMPRYDGPLDCLKQTLHAEGVRGLFRGMTSPLATIALYHAVQFGTFAEARRLIAGADVSRAETALHDIGVAAAIAGVVSSLVATPTDLVKARLQTAYRESQGSGVGSLECARHVYRSAGIAGFYRGWTPFVIAKITGNYTSFIANEVMRRWLTPAGAKEPTAMGSFVAGGITGMIFWTTVFPLDAIKIRMQTDVAGRYRTPSHCFMETVRVEGWRGLYRGFTPSLLRAYPACAALFVTYDLIASGFGTHSTAPPDH